MTTTKPDSKFMALVLTQEGFMRWCEEKPLQITDVKPEYQAALAHNFIQRRTP